MVYAHVHSLRYISYIFCHLLPGKERIDRTCLRTIGRGRIRLVYRKYRTILYNCQRIKCSVNGLKLRCSGRYIYINHHPCPYIHSPSLPPLSSPARETKSITRIKSFHQLIQSNPIPSYPILSILRIYPVMYLGDENKQGTGTAK